MLSLIIAETFFKHNRETSIENALKMLKLNISAERFKDVTKTIQKIRNKPFLKTFLKLFVKMCCECFL